MNNLTVTAGPLGQVAGGDGPPYHRNILGEELSAKPNKSATGILRLKVAAAELGIAEATLRDLRFYSEGRKPCSGQTLPGNGFAPAFLKLGRAVYIDVAKFVAIWRSQQHGGGERG